MEVADFKETINLTLEPGDVVLPCPFCGFKKVALQNTWTTVYWVRCPRCDAKCGGKYYGAEEGEYSRRMHERAKRSALRAWNRRKGGV